MIPIRTSSLRNRSGWQATPRLPARASAVWAAAQSARRRRIEFHGHSSRVQLVRVHFRRRTYDEVGTEPAVLAAENQLRLFLRRDAVSHRRKEICLQTSGANALVGAGRAQQQTPPEPQIAHRVSRKETASAPPCGSD